MVSDGNTLGDCLANKQASKVFTELEETTLASSVNCSKFDKAKLKSIAQQGRALARSQTVIAFHTGSLEVKQRQSSIL